MTAKEFSIKCQPHNLKYRDLFGDIPCRQDYACTQDEYYDALINSINNKKPISEYLRKKTIPKGENIKI